MTAPTTRERVARAIDSALRNNAVVGLSFRALESATDAALAAMQPPPETRWGVSDTTWERWIEMRDIMSADREHLRAITPNLLRDFADGVSDEGIIAAFMAADRNTKDPDSSHEYGREFLRALADQEEGK